MAEAKQSKAGRFQGKRVIVTGASAGIGRAIAIAFAAEGATVAVMARRKQLLDELVQKEMGGRGVAVPADFHDLEQVTRGVQEAVKLLGGLDVLVNNVGGGSLAWASLPLSEQHPLFMRFNLETAERATDAALPALLESKGAIVNIGSNAGSMPGLLFAGYSVAKAALHHVSKIRACQLARKGVTVNVVAPGVVPTDVFLPMKEAGVDLDAFYRTRAERHLDGRNATVEEVAQAVLFLSDKTVSGHITGHVLPVDGGTLDDFVFNIPDDRPFEHA